MTLFVPVEKRHEQKCPKCGQRLEKLLSVAVPHIFKPYYDDMMADPPVYIESAKQKKKELEARGLDPKN